MQNKDGLNGLAIVSVILHSLFCILHSETRPWHRHDVYHSADLERAVRQVDTAFESRERNGNRTAGLDDHRAVAEGADAALDRARRAEHRADEVAAAGDRPDLSRGHADLAIGQYVEGALVVVGEELELVVRIGRREDETISPAACDRLAAGEEGSGRFSRSSHRCGRV